MVLIYVLGLLFKLDFIMILLWEKIRSEKKSTRSLRNMLKRFWKKNLLFKELLYRNKTHLNYLNKILLKSNLLLIKFLKGLSLLFTNVVNWLTCVLVLTFQLLWKLRHLKFWRIHQLIGSETKTTMFYKEFTELLTLKNNN